MKLVCSLAEPTSGSFELCGQTYPALGAVREKAGNLIETPGYFEKMTAYDNLKAKAMMYGLDDKKHIQDILKLIGLENAGSKRAGKFSLGMLQRLGIGLALISDPEVLILDEPINGLDPTGVAEVRETLKRLNTERGITILISSHILGELSKLATDYAFIEQGKLIREITHDDLAAECADYVRLVVTDEAAAAQVLNSMGITDFTAGDVNGMRLNGCTARTAEINAALVHAGVGVVEISKQGIDLEDYYLNLIGAGGKEGAAC
jgi:ABC-2 type transport system ATP-binding protein